MSVCIRVCETWNIRSADCDVYHGRCKRFFTHKVAALYHQTTGVNIIFNNVIILYTT